MSYVIRHTPEFEDCVRGWGLTPNQAAEVRFRLAEDLTDNPGPHLHPVRNDPTTWNMPSRVRS